MSITFFDVIQPAAKEIPVVVEIPHAGLWAPASTLSHLIVSARSIAYDADLFVDELFEDASLEGATQLVARTSRYVVDLNRDEHDIDNTVVEEARPPTSKNTRGVIWGATADGKPAIARPLSYQEYRYRIEQVYRPYHTMLQQLLTDKIARFGFAILVCAHSMPSVGRIDHQTSTRRADVVPGSQNRTTAHSAVIDTVEKVALEFGLSVEHDYPYRGGYSTTHYGQPTACCHAIQIELARRLYLNEQNLEKIDGGVARTKKLCRSFIARLGALSL